MGKIELNLIDEICNKQDFDEILLNITKQNKEKGIKKILQDISEGSDMPEEIKRQIYDEIFKYVIEVNENIKKNIKYIFKCGVEETIKKINNN